MFASALTEESFAITYPSVWLVGLQLALLDFHRPTEVKWPEREQKRPKVPNVFKSIIKKYPSFIRNSFIESYVLKSVFPGRCGWP